ncbi:MAG TPA: hypothetical protein VK582_24385 [Pyrinomonadaceae bacterium]|nr:hypothetical protein [Pyrinomonadaceae bacterium]
MDPTDEAKDKIRSAIEALRGRLVAKLAAVETTKATMAGLYAELGEPLPSLEELTGNAIGLHPYGSKLAYKNKKLATAVKLYLNQQGRPCTVIEIREALQAGGFRFAQETSEKKKQDQIELLRRSLRRNTRAFFRVGSDSYGLRSWYEGA